MVIRFSEEFEKGFEQHLKDTKQKRALRECEARVAACLDVVIEDIKNGNLSDEEILLLLDTINERK